MTRARLRKWVVAVALTALLGAGATWDLLPAPGAPEPPLIFGLSAEPVNLDPNLSVGAAAQTVKMQLYSGLFRFGTGGTVQNDLVASYEQPTPTTYVFHLRRNLKFSDGSPLTATDVAFTFERIADAKVGAYLRTLLGGVQSVDVVDPQTVKVTLSAPDAVFTTLLALPQAAIVSKAFALAHNDDLKAATLGEGPYVLGEWQRGVQLTVERNPNYYQRGLPRTSEIRFVFYPDDNSRFAALESGAVDMIEYVPWQDISAIRANPEFGYQGTHGPFMYLQFNVTQAPFNDARVRRAIGYAIDRDAIVKTAFFGRGTPIYGLPITKGKPGVRSGPGSLLHLRPRQGQTDARGGRLRERVHGDPAQHVPVRDAQGHRAGRAAEPERDRGARDAGAAGLGDPHRDGQRRTLPVRGERRGRRLPRPGLSDGVLPLGSDLLQLHDRVRRRDDGCDAEHGPRHARSGRPCGHVRENRAEGAGRRRRISS